LRFGALTARNYFRKGGLTDWFDNEQKAVTQVKKEISTPFGQPSLPRGWRFLDLFHAASSHTRNVTLIAVALAWIPVAILSAIRGRAAFSSFLTDYATQSRFLIILPVLILAEPQLRQRLALVAHQFEADIVPRDQWPEFQSNWALCENRRDSNVARVLIIVLTYATAAFMTQYLNPGGSEFVSWWKGGGGFRSFSLAGSWAFLVSYPILAYYTYLWIWRHLLWGWFLRSTTRLKLALIAAHPDHVGGLGFLEASLLGQVPFSFCVGVGLAGAIAIRVLNEGHPLLAFRFVALGFVLGVILFCVGPYLFFTQTLLQMRRRGMLAYGGFARAVGEQFEKKWLHQTDSLTEDVLSVPDFSTTADLYGMVGNIDDIRVVPVAAVNVYAIVVAALAPALPVVIASIPFNDLIRAAMGLLF